MKTAGIIAEYNPFHKGHELLIRKARENGATHVVTVMSGNCVQRGETAIFGQRARASAALECGADLVLQLPVVYAASGAQSFARAGVRVLDALSCVDELVFGSECGDAELILSAAKAIYSEEVQGKIAQEIKKGITFAAARENALRAVDSRLSDIIQSPNNILGVEYAAAIEMLGSKMKPVTFNRIGAGHGENGDCGGIASASYIRELIKNGGEWQRFVPEAAAKIFEAELSAGNAVVNSTKFETAVLYKMRTVSSGELALAPDVSEGVENRILSAAASATTLDELYDMAKTKRYTHARIRRIVLNNLIGITAADLAVPVPYMRLLGLNDRGAELLKLTNESRKLPLISKTADIAQADSNSTRVFELECRAADIRALCCGKTAVCASERDYTVVKL